MHVNVKLTHQIFIQIIHWCGKPVSWKIGSKRIWELDIDKQGMGFRNPQLPKIWHLGILNILSWKSSENTAEAGRPLRPSLPLFSYLNPAHLLRKSYGLRVRGVLPLPLGKEHFHLQRPRETKKNSNKRNLLSLPQFTILTSYSLTYLIPPHLSILHQA